MTEAETTQATGTGVSGDGTAGGDVVRRVTDGVAWIVLNRPDAGNAMTGAMRDQISEWVDEASADLAVRVVVITAAGDRAFCSGADLRGGQSAAPPRPEGAPDNAVGDASRVIRRGWQRLVASILDCEKPVIAAVNGTAAGGGMHLALACDLVVAAENARFIEVFIRRGIAPDAGGAWLLARLIGIQKAKELFFFGDDVGAAEAHRIGLVNRVVPADQLEATVTELATRLAQGPTKAIGVAKWLTNRSLDVDRQTAFAEEALAQEMITRTEDSHEGIRSFVERRPSEFKGW
jgi:2-(1,2-epoxy-1,2-dihydrophenyl)acetyl-CoA isomerase